MLINVLKVFDIIISIAPGSSQDDANVIALAMWRTSFGGVNDFGVGSAIAVFIFLLVIPILLLNVRRLPEGGLVTAVAVTRRRSVVEEGASRGCCACSARRRCTSSCSWSALLWLVPTIGLFVTSLLAPEDFQGHGWWQVFTAAGHS